MSNIDKSSLAKTRELATLMVERISMNPVSCKLLNEAWKKEFPDEVAIADRMLALLDELEAVQTVSAARLAAIDTTHKMFQRGRDRADAADKRSAELSQKADICDMLRQDYELQGSLVEFVDWQAKRIAELEAREVKLPELKMLRDNLAEVTMREREDILVGVRLEFFRALEEACVKVSAAGKGE